MEHFADLRIMSFWMGKAMGKTATGHTFAACLSPRAEAGNLRTGRFPEGGHIRSLEIATGEDRISDRRTVWWFAAGKSHGYDPDCDPAALGQMAARIAKFCEETFFLAVDA